MTNDRKTAYRFHLQSPGPRPPFYEVVNYVYGVATDVDTDGNSMTRDAVDWTELYMAQRPEREPLVEVFPVASDPLVLCIESESEPFARRTAEFLRNQCGGALTICPPEAR